MGEQMYELTIEAIGEVRDKDGNLLSSEPIKQTIVVNAEQAAAFGLTPEGAPS